MTRGRVAVVLGGLLAALAAALVLRRGGDGPSAEVGAATSGDGTDDPGSADARPAAVPLAATGHAPAAGAGGRNATGRDAPGSDAATHEGSVVVEVLAPDRTPVEGAEVFATTYQGDVQLRTDALGRGRIPTRLFPSTSIVVRAVGHPTVRRPAPNGGLAADRVQIVLPAGVRVWGVVRWPDGTAAARAIVEVRDALGADDAVGPDRSPPLAAARTPTPPGAAVIGRWREDRRTITDEHGAFDLSVEGDAPIVVEIVAHVGRFLRAVEAARVTACTRGQPLELELVRDVPAPGSLHARLAFPGAAPSVNDFRWSMHRSDRPDWSLDRPRERPETVADPEVIHFGHVLAILGLPAGHYRLRIETRGHLPVERDVDIGEAATDLGTIEFDAGAVLRGTAIIAGGSRPDDDWTIEAFAADETDPGPNGSASLDEEGRFAVAGLTPGRYRLRVDRGHDPVALVDPGEALGPWSSATVVVVPRGGVALDEPLRFDETAVLELTVVRPGDADGAFDPADVCTVTTAQGDLLWRGRLGTDTPPLRRILPRGQWTLTVESGGRRIQQSVDLRTGGVVSVCIAPGTKALPGPRFVRCPEVGKGG